MILFALSLLLAQMPAPLLASQDGAKPASRSAAGAETDVSGPTVIGTYRIPYRLTESQHLMVRARLNGHGPYNFIIDTGAPALYVSHATAKQAGIVADAQGWGAVRQFDLEGGAKLHAISARVEDPMQLTSMNAMGLSSQRIDGILGYTVLARFRITIDLSQPRMEWTQFDITPPDPPAAQELAGKTPFKMPQEMGQMQRMAQATTQMFARKPVAPVGHGFFGLEFGADARPAPANGKPAGKPNGATIQRVLPGSPAETARLQPGDRITGVKTGEQPMQDTVTAADVREQTAQSIGGDSVQFCVWRGSRKLLLTVRVGVGGL